jgi:hypothetical protein
MPGHIEELNGARKKNYELYSVVYDPRQVSAEICRDTWDAFSEDTMHFYLVSRHLYKRTPTSGREWKAEMLSK